jgi:hypothetical protein
LLAKRAERTLPPTVFLNFDARVFFTRAGSIEFWRRDYAHEE